ncbi:hypothetical protein [Streptomyces sp. NPDC012825]|uniref:hypothetical protein n=1 Tax=Streptomyces sp. NPDC012825 TaxID=3364851 RepID=UPI0036A6A2F2
MRSARILFAATATAAALAVTTPGAYALATGDDWSKDDSAHSQERDHDKPHGGMHTGSGALSLLSDDWSKDEHDKKDHGKPRGGVHTGGGALTATNGDEWSKEHDKGEKHEKDHGKPQGGMHTGGGALTMVNADDWSKPETESKPEHESKPETKDHEKDWGKEHDKPKGGMHTGGGGLAGSGTNVTGAVVLAGGVAAFVLYRRKKAAGTTA